MPNTDLGKVSLTPRGAYDSAVSYEPLDVVEYQGSGYIVRRSVQGVAPVDGDDYMLVVQKGDTGATGPEGAKGETGDTGITGDRGPQGEPGVGVPDGGTEGQLLGRTADGTAWVDPPQSGVQPDWNQNDETAPDYVKNRTHYSETVTMNVALEQTVITASHNDFIIGSFVAVDGVTDFEAGDAYNVIFDGENYEAIATALGSGSSVVNCVGNPSFLGMDYDNGMPFALIFDAGTPTLSCTVAGNHTLSITRTAIQIRCLDDKYLNAPNFYIHYDGITIDKTADEIKNALVNGYNCIYVDQTISSSENEILQSTRITMSDDEGYWRVEFGCLSSLYDFKTGKIAAIKTITTFIEYDSEGGLFLGIPTYNTIFSV